MKPDPLGQGDRVDLLVHAQDLEGDPVPLVREYATAEAAELEDVAGLRVLPRVTLWGRWGGCGEQRGRGHAPAPPA